MFLSIVYFFSTANLYLFYSPFTGTEILFPPKTILLANQLIKLFYKQSYAQYY